MSTASVAEPIRQTHAQPFSQRIVQDEVEGWCEDCPRDKKPDTPERVRWWADRHSRRTGHTVKTMRTTVRVYGDG